MRKGGGEHFTSLPNQKSECVTEVNKKFLSFIIQNKTDERQADALTKAYNLFYKGRAGYCSYDCLIKDLIQKLLKENNETRGFLQVHFSKC